MMCVDRYFYSPEMSGDAVLVDRELAVTMGIGGPLLEQCDLIVTVLRIAQEDSIEVDGGAMGVAAAIFLAARGIDVTITFPWDRD